MTRPLSIGKPGTEETSKVSQFMTYGLDSKSRMNIVIVLLERMP